MPQIIDFETMLPETLLNIFCFARDEDYFVDDNDDEEEDYNEYDDEEDEDEDEDDDWEESEWE